MPFVVLPAHIADIEPVYDVYFEAFKDEPILKFLYPRGVDRKAHTEAMAQWWGHDRISYTIKCLNADTGKIVGMATWDVFHRPGEGNGWERPAGIPWLEGKEKERAEGVLNGMWDMREKLFGARHKYIYLSVIAVHPEHQRQGVGRRLMQWGIDVAEQFGVPIYTEASPSGLGLYQSVGFEHLSHLRLVHRQEVTGLPDAEVPLVARMPAAARGLRFREWEARGCPETYGVDGSSGAQDAGRAGCAAM
ncbi:acyl-CoA N-acyltransferase [Durotheca rogersii]|uniref:acyl-CoA N-acyltransferase n=1 Tax=Durotheca rogersii TaxID=419775 RepID=UPI0022212280|nr:acyl-CoA N-acyltransferase [Durotheca rogersii]KAI5863131.1 acyl-CoA N-acyltransferase [Durotheca rogersii]